MKHLILAAFLVSAASAATAADRNFGVSGFDRIRVDGAYKVVLTVGAPPFARATGSTRALDPVDIIVEGRTLVIHPNRSAWGGYDHPLPYPPHLGGGNTCCSLTICSFTIIGRRRFIPARHRNKTRSREFPILL